MASEVIDSFLPQLLAYADKEVLLTLFGGEPLVNRQAVERVFDWVSRHGTSFAEAGGRLWVKIVTNGSLLDEHLERIKRAVKTPGVAVEINISIDGGPETQLRQRPLRGKGQNYYPRLARSIMSAKTLGARLSLGMVAGFSSPSLIDDFTYLCDTFKLPVFLMPVDLTYAFIKSRPDIAARLQAYARKLRDLMAFLKTRSAYGRMAVNLGERDFRDLKMPPLGPTIDWDGSVYVTRDFLFTMDKESTFEPIGSLTAKNLPRFVRHFGASRDDLAPLAASAMRAYFGRTMVVNKKVGDYFTRMVYGKASAS